MLCLTGGQSSKARKPIFKGVAMHHSMSSVSYILACTLFTVGQVIYADCPSLLVSGVNYSLPQATCLPSGAIACSPNGDYCAVISPDHVNVVTVEAQGVLGAWKSYRDGGGAHGLAFSSNSLYLALATGDVTVFTVGIGGQLSESKRYPLPQGSQGANSIAFSPNGSLCATANIDSKNVTVFDVSQDGILSNGRSYELPSGSSQLMNDIVLTFSPDGKYLATANFRSNFNGLDDVVLFRVGEDGALDEGTSYPLPAGCVAPRSIAISPDGNYLVTANQNSSNVTLFHLEKGGRLSRPTAYKLPSDSRIPRSLAFSSNGSYLVVANYGFWGNGHGVSNVTLFEVQNEGKLTRATSYPLPEGSFMPDAVAFLPNSLYFFTSSQCCWPALCSGQSHIILFQISCPSQGDGDNSTTTGSTSDTKIGSDDLPLSLILGTTVGIPAGLASLVATAVGGFFLYKYLSRLRAARSSTIVDTQLPLD